MWDIKTFFLLWFVVFVTLASVKGCDDTPEFTPDYVKLDYQAKVTFLPDKGAVQKEYERVRELADPETSVRDISKVGEFARNGFSYTKGETCHIVVIEQPRGMNIAEYSELVGHENLHCMFGRWHGDSSKYPRISLDVEVKVGYRGDP